MNVQTDSNQPNGLYMSPNTDLRGAINHINENPSSFTGIVFDSSLSQITLGSMLPILQLNYTGNPLTIDGTVSAGILAINGVDTWRGFYVKGGPVTLQNLSLIHMTATGGTGGGGGRLRFCR